MYRENNIHNWIIVKELLYRSLVKPYAIELLWATECSFSSTTESSSLSGLEQFYNSFFYISDIVLFDFSHQHLLRAQEEKRNNLPKCKTNHPPPETETLPQQHSLTAVQKQHLFPCKVSSLLNSGQMFHMSGGFLQTTEMDA